VTLIGNRVSGRHPSDGLTITIVAARGDNGGVSNTQAKNGSPRQCGRGGATGKYRAPAAQAAG
jgi:hypothetical protein